MTWASKGFRRLCGRRGITQLSWKNWGGKSIWTWRVFTQSTLSFTMDLSLQIWLKEAPLDWKIRTFLVNVSWVVFLSQDTSDHQYYFLEPFIKGVISPHNFPVCNAILIRVYFTPLITIGLWAHFPDTLENSPMKKNTDRQTGDPRSESVTQASSSQGDPWGEMFFVKRWWVVYIYSMSWANYNDQTIVFHQ